MDKRKAARDRDRGAQACPCGLGLYANCCAPLHDGAGAADASQLMRARYSAYALGKSGYVRATWHARTRPGSLDPEPDVKWLGLQVLRHESGPQQAQVEFVARYKQNGRAQRLHEISRFVHEEGQWWYLDGEHPET